MINTTHYRFELIMDAGNGAQKAGDILIKTFAKTGRYVFIEPLIPAEISPPKRTPHSLSGAVIRVSKEDISNIGSMSELMVAEHEILLKRRLEDHEYHPTGTILLDMGQQDKNADAYEAAIKTAKDANQTVIPFQISELAQDTMKEINGNGKNMYYLGLLTAVFNIDEDELEKEIRATFKKLKPEILNHNITIYKEGLRYAKTAHGISTLNINIHTKETDSSSEQLLLDGNTAMACGIIDAGIKVFSGYPITPASSIMHTLAQNFHHYGGVLHQAEDEISAIGAVIGSYFTGTPAITATAGPGLSLKQEFLGFSVASEVPCIVIDVQRGGPSTGLPTRTEQTDLFPAVFGSHGDAPKIALSVANVEDCFYAPHVARYLTEKLRMPVIILSDYQTSVSYRVLEKMELAELDDVNDISDEVLARFKLNRLPDNIEMVKLNLENPGVEGKTRRVTGLNTDAGGNVMYTAESNQRSHDVRNNKLKVVRENLTMPELFGDEEGDLLVVSWGSQRGVLQESVEKARANGLKVSGLHFKMVYPLPFGLTDVFKKFKKVVTAEVAYASDFKPSPFAMMLRSETLIDIDCAINQATGRPLKPAQLLEKITALCH